MNNDNTKGESATSESMSRKEILSRRKLLGQLGAVAGGAGVLAACGQSPSATAETTEAEAAPQLDINLQDPSESLKHFTRIFGDTNVDNVTTGWFEGTVYSVIGDSSQVTPLLGLEGVGIMRVQPVDTERGPGYRVFNRELAFYKDLRTGKFVDEWTNPLNGKLVETFPMHNMTVNAETAPILKFDVEGTEISIPFPASWRTVGPYVFSTFEIHTSVPSELQPEEWPMESPGPMTRISEMFQRTVNMSDLRNPELTSIPYTGTWTRLSSWYPWMLMGQAEGNLYFRANMAKLSGPEEIPAAFVEKANEKHAAYLEPPSLDSWGQPNDSTYNTYERERSPQPVDGDS
ncbi:MAG: DUF1838 family protein [Gammaproteobacteria bacterium]|nr:DUF1838 family protein [Gammaproteobacteria bacterium]